LGLPAFQEEDLGKQTESLDVEGGKAILVDMIGTDSRSGKKARLVGAVVPQPDTTWFYKMLGDETVVEREKQTFARFVQSAKYSNVP
jgi:hypothetical protein